MLSKDEKTVFEALRESTEKHALKRIQRIYLKYNQNEEKNCLCTKVSRRIWKDIFYNWFDNVKKD